MTKFRMASLVAWMLALTAAAWAAGKDSVTLDSGRIEANLTILREGWDQLEVDRDGDGKADEPIPADTVAEVSFEDEPQAFRAAKVALKYGRMEDAAENFAKALEDKTARAFWLQPHANYHLGECRRALAEADKALYPEARAAYEAALTASPDGRLAPFAVERTGLCLLAEGKSDEAVQRFRKLADGAYGKAFELRGKLRLAQATGQANQHEEALKTVEEVVARATAEGRKELLGEARLVRPELLIGAKRYAEAREQFLKVASEATEQDVNTKARAYNGVGDCLLAEGQPRDALLAYLRVRVLYFKSDSEYPRALFGAARCFTLLKEPARAKEIVDLLARDYATTAWAVRAQQEL